MTCQNILNYTVYSGSLEQCADSVVSRITNNDSPCWLACMNPHSYVVALDDSEFATALHGADWLIPDGSGIVLASHLLRGNIRERITGSDIFSALNSKANEVGGLGVFFLGSTLDCLEEIRVRMQREYPQIRFAGNYSQPFKQHYTEDDLEAMIASINQASPDILWVGMTAPKQEKWIHQNLPRLNVRFAAAIGAVFDFYAGHVKRAPTIVQKIGLEWFVRSIQEPRRLWRRHYVNAPIFMWHVLKAAIRRIDKRRR